MNTRKDKLSLSDIESLLHDADQFIDNLFPQTEADVADMQAMFGSTPVKLPERLHDPKAVLERIIERELIAPKPSAFGKLVTMLRTERKLSVNQLAQRVDLDEEDLQNIECGVSDASPLAVTVLAEFFKLQPHKVMRMAGLTRESADGPQGEILSVAACAKPNFDSLDSQELAMFHALVTQLRNKG